ncbi:cation-transporting P-type ATPase [Candidatus Peregrinibacteria bacterium]|nr:cation-transporting P-type ATPase [Candidatus Peregrinibacteria bacterium]
MSKELILQFSIFILSGIPFSLIIILAYARFFSPYNSSLAKATTIITNISGNLIHENLAVKSLIFDKYEAMMDEKSNFTYIENHDTKEDLKLDKRELRKELTMQLIAAISALCHYPKHQEIETVISKFLKNCAMDEKRLGQKYGIITHIPTSEVKKISTIVAIDKESEEIFAFNKGNPSAILERCTRIFLNGKNTGLTSNQIRKLKIQIEKLNQKGEKTIAFAYKPLPKKKLENYTDQFTENDLVLLGIIGLGNYIKDNLYETVENIKKDGIKIYIVSSLKGRKALAIGRDLGIVNPRYFEVISSKDLENIPQEKLRKMIKNKEKDYIFCDITDENRPKIIDALREEGETTAIATKENGLKT